MCVSQCWCVVLCCVVLLLFAVVVDRCCCSRVWCRDLACAAGVANSLVSLLSCVDADAAVRDAAEGVVFRLLGTGLSVQSASQAQATESVVGAGAAVAQLRGVPSQAFTGAGVCVECVRVCVSVYECVRVCSGRVFFAVLDMTRHRSPTLLYSGDRCPDVTLTVCACLRPRCVCRRRRLRGCGRRRAARVCGLRGCSVSCCEGWRRCRRG